MTQKRRAQIVLPILIAGAIAGVWMLKNNSTADLGETSDTSADPLTVSQLELEEWTQSGLPVIVDFGSEGCPPCRDMKPALEAIHQEMQGKAVVKYIDIWEYPAEVKDMPVTVIPTQIFINADGTPYVPSQEISEALGLIQYNYKDTNEHAYTVHQGGLTEEQFQTILEDMGVEV
ncbi:MAG: thioredoxin family protein [Eubacteriales bacterium]